MWDYSGTNSILITLKGFSKTLKTFLWVVVGEGFTMRFALVASAALRLAPHRRSPVRLSLVVKQLSRWFRSL